MESSHSIESNEEAFKVESNILPKQESLIRPWLIIGCAWVFYLYEYLLRVSPGVMTNQLMLDFGVTSTTLGVLTSFYYWAYVPLQIPCGMIVDSFGARRVLTFSAVFCVVGCILFSYSTNLPMAQLGRFLMGAGSACAYLSCAKLATNWFSSSKFAFLIGITMMMGTFGGSFGASPFATLVNNFGWRNAMLIAGVAGAFVAMACWFVVRDNPSDDRKEANQKSLNVENINSAKVSPGFFSGLKLIAPNTQIWLIGLYGLVMFLPLSIFAELWGVPFLMENYGINNQKASLGSIMILIGMAIGSPLGALLSDYLKSRKKVMSLACLGTMVCLALAIYIPKIDYNLTLTFLFLCGFFCGGQILYFVAAKENCPNHLSATAIGFTNAIIMFGAIVFQPFLGWLLDLFWGGQFTAEGVRFYSIYSYKCAFAALIAALSLGLVFMCFIKETFKSN